MKKTNRHNIPGFPWKRKFTNRSEVEEYFSNEERIQCLLCGRLMGTLQNHLQLVHGVSHQQYRVRYGLPWRKGLVSRAVSKNLRTTLTNRIKNGSFKPIPNYKAGVKKILDGFRRPDQPYITSIKVGNSKALSQQNIKYGSNDFENVLSVMREHKITLNQACKNYNLPGKATVLRYAELNPRFRKILVETYHGLPYSVQARADMFSPQFYRELRALKRKGLPATEIGKLLGVSHKTIRRHFKKLP
jgi:hypothetical protein